MSATDAQVARLRRMTDEPMSATYSDDDLKGYIERHPIIDACGRPPEHADWDADYDLNASAAEIWGEKAAALSGDYDVTADGADLKRSQRYEQAKAQARHYAARRKAGSSRVFVSPRIPATDAALAAELLALEDSIESEDD